MNFTEKFGSDATIWYPASGLRNVFGEIVNVVDYGYSWSASSRFYLQFNAGGRVLPFNSKDCARGQAVRCQKEN
jgi:hypothetical protein